MTRTNLLTSALLLLALAGCSSNSSSGASTSPSSTGAKLKVVFIPKNTGNPYFDEVYRGFKDAGAQLNLDCSTNAPASADATSQVSVITDQIQRGVDVIIISANSPDALNQVLDQAKAKGITVITVDSDLVGNESHRDAAVLPVNAQDVGPAQVELLGKMIGYQGNFAILSATSDAPNQNAWIAGMKETLKQPKYAKMALVDTVYGDDEPQKSATECDGLLSKHSDLAGIISPTSVGLAAAAQELERNGNYPGGSHMVGKGIQLTGLSTPNQMKKFVKEGAVTSFQLWEPYDEGYLAAYIGEQIHDKKIVPKAGLEIDVPKLGKRGFTSKLEIVGGKMQTFDKANIDATKF